ncbi:MAG: hypothetical protein WBK73_09750, partial [Tepidanaerobacteraceae bacterium]
GAIYRAPKWPFVYFHVPDTDRLKESRHSFGRRSLCKALPVERPEEFNVDVHVNSKVVEITDDGVVIDKDGEKITLGGFDNVVIAVGVKAVNDLAEKLQGKAPEVIVIGDAREARKALQDVHEGYEAGLQV